MTGGGGTAGRGQGARSCCPGRRQGRCRGALASPRTGTAGWPLLPALPRTRPGRRGGSAGPGGAATRCTSSCTALGVNKGRAGLRRHRNSCAGWGEQHGREGSRSSWRAPVGGEDRAKRTVENPSSTPWERPGGRGGARASRALSPLPGAAPLAAAGRSREAFTELPLHSCPAECSRSTKESLAFIISQLTKYVKNAFVQKANFNNKHILDITTVFT